MEPLDSGTSRIVEVARSHSDYPLPWMERDSSSVAEQLLARPP